MLEHGRGEWEREVLIGFKEIHGEHALEGVNIGSIIKNILNKYSIQDQLPGFMTEYSCNNGILAEAF
jgi:hypothetical protein